MLVYCTRKIRKVPVNRHNCVKVRSHKNYSKEVLEYKLQEVNWQDVYDCDSVCNAWCIFKCKFLSIVDAIAPLKNVCVKPNTAPWMTGEIMHLISERNLAFRKFKTSKDHSFYDKYVYLRNQVHQKKKVAKSEYINNKINEYKQQPKKLWQILKGLGTTSQSKTKPGNIGLNIDNEICFDKQKVSDKFNIFFTTVSSSLVNKLPPCTGRFGLSYPSVLQFL